MDVALPAIRFGPDGEAGAEVPVVRSKLHRHRGVAGYDPRYVEHAVLDPPYYLYPVSCATDAQARAIKDAFARSEALQNPDDPRQVVFTVLPGHGVVIAEKWVRDKALSQVIWEYMDAGYLEVARQIPQEPMRYVAAGADRMVLQVL